MTATKQAKGLPLTPQTVAKLRRLPLTERKIYAQELSGKYEKRVLRLHNKAANLAVNWTLAQRLYFQTCINELTAIVEEQPTQHEYFQLPLEM